MKIGELGRVEDGQRPLEFRESQARDLEDEPSSLGGEITFDDPPVVGAVVTLDEPVPLHALDQATGTGRGQLEQRGDAAHRLGALAMEQEQQADLTEGEVAGWDRRASREGPEQAQEIGGHRREVGRGLGGRSISAR